MLIILQTLLQLIKYRLSMLLSAEYVPLVNLVNSSGTRPEATME